MLPVASATVPAPDPVNVPLHVWVPVPVGFRVDPEATVNVPLLLVPPVKASVPDDTATVPPWSSNDRLLPSDVVPVPVSFSNVPPARSTSVPDPVRADAVSDDRL